MFKRILVFVMAMTVLASLAGCETDRRISFKKDEHHEMIEEAVELLLETWEEEYEDSNMDTDGYVQIINTRLLVFEENTEKYYEDIAYVVEFEIFSDYYGSAPYYPNVNYMNNVVVYTDGDMEVVSNYIHSVYARTYSYDLSDVLDEVRDYGDRYNVEEELL